MKNLKRVLSLALSTAMVLGMMVVGSSAADADKVYANEKAIATVKVLEIMEGDENGNFNADKVVTRNEMAVVMSNLKDLKLNGTHPFTDVPAWADKYVAAVFTNGISAGTSATTYGGSENVTAAQAALMLMKTLGWFEHQSEFKDDWKLETVKRAADLELFDDVDAGVDEGLTRGELAQMIYNVLDCQTITRYEVGGMKVEGNGMTVTSNPEYEDHYGDRLIKDIYGISWVGNLQAGATDAYGRPGVEIEYAKSDVDAIKVIKTPAYTFTNTDGDLTDAQMLVDDEKLDEDDFCIFNAGDSDEYDVWAELANWSIGKGYVVELFESEVWVNSDNEVVSADAYGAKEKDLITDFIIYYYDAFQIDELKECDEDDDEEWIEAGAKYYIETKDGDIYYDIQIVGFDADEYVDDAWVMAPVNQLGVYPNDPEGLEVDDNDEKVYYGMTIPETVSGVVENVRDNGKKVTIDGTKYEALSAVSCEAEDEYKLILDPAGYVIATEEIENNATLEDVYVWVDTYKSDVKWGNEVYAVLVDMKGEVTELKIDADYTTAAATDKDGNSYTNIIATSMVMDGVEYKDAAGNKVEYAPATEGMLVEVKENDDDKNVLIEWANEDDFDIGTIAAGTDIEKSQSRFGTKRLNADTQYVLVEGIEDDIKATVKTGGVNMTANYGYYITEDDEKEVLFVVIVEEEVVETAAAEDLLYIYEVDKYEAKDYFKQEVIFANGTVEEIKIDNNSKSLVDGNEDDDATNGGTWYTFTINSDGYYELKNIASSDIVDITGDEWDNEDGLIVNATLDEFYKGQVTLNGGDYIDIDVADEVVFIDMHDEEDEDNGAWDKKVRTLDKLWDLIDADEQKVDGVSIELVVDEDDGVTLVILNWIAEYVAP